MNKQLTVKKALIFGVGLAIIVGFALERISSLDGTSKGLSKGAKGSVFQALVGQPAPDFELIDRSGNKVTNESLRGKRVILFFNEGLACYPACWNQMVELGKDSRFNQDDVVEFSVVTDAQERWQEATTKMPDLAAVKLALDNGSASGAFGATDIASSMHAGQPGHSYVVLDKEGIVRYVLDDPRMAINNEQLYAEVEKLK